VNAFSANIQLPNWGRSLEWSWQQKAFGAGRSSASVDSGGTACPSPRGGCLSSHEKAFILAALPSASWDVRIGLPVYLGMVEDQVSRFFRRGCCLFKPTRGCLSGRVGYPPIGMAGSNPAKLWDLESLKYGLCPLETEGLSSFILHRVHHFGFKPWCFAHRDRGV
jgi:hypothetical protein